MADSISTGVAYRDALIVGGLIENTTVGATSAAAGKFTTVTGTTINATAGLVGVVGSVSAAAGAFTTLNASGGLDNTVIGSVSAVAGTFTALRATTGYVGVVGSVSAAAGTFTTLSGTGNVAFGTTSANTTGFYGAAAVAQRQSSVAPAVATTVGINSSISSSCFGFTSGQCVALIALVNELRAAAVALGLIAT